MGSLLAYAVRVYLYTLLTPNTANYILLIESLHGLTFAMFWCAAVDFTAKEFGEKFSTTGQLLLSAIYAALGPGIGAGVGGWIAQVWGFHTLYWYASMSAFGLLGLHALLILFNGKGLYSHETENNVTNVKTPIPEVLQEQQPAEQSSLE